MKIAILVVNNSNVSGRVPEARVSGSESSIKINFENIDNMGKIGGKLKKKSLLNLSANAFEFYKV